MGARQPQKIQSPCGGLGAPPARRHVQPAHTAGLHSRGPAEALVLAAQAPRGGPAVGNAVRGSEDHPGPGGEGGTAWTTDSIIPQQPHPLGPTRP